MNPLSGKINLDFRSSEPIYLQIAQQIQQLVMKGDLKLGDQLPTVREMATELRINFNTVSRAYRLLDETRLISTQRGRGTYIWEEPDEAMKQKLRQKGLEELALRYLKEAGKLGYTPAEAIETLKQLAQSGQTSLSDEDQQEER
ncbi:MAG TPA: GntR family transcriptional regulator [Anaerolineaceae bacterium]|nr:GntR family transcriptional regulator [Anaerolineaceae bacterium]HPN50719.1 GntR family transcriptional regulator [Anaerolineaceae bacterium]